MTVTPEPARPICWLVTVIAWTMRVYPKLAALPAMSDVTFQVAVPLCVQSSACEDTESTIAASDVLRQGQTFSLLRFSLHSLGFRVQG